MFFMPCFNSNSMAEKTYSCILLDDELLGLSYLRTLCERIPQMEVIRAFNDPQVFLDELASLRFDFVISDIVMPTFTGLEVAEKLNGIPVIFTTAHNEYAADAFDVDAIDFLRKPVQQERLEKAVRKAIDFIERNATEVKWNATTAKGKMTFHCGDLVSFSANTIDSRDKLLLLKNGTTEIIKNKSFQQLTEELTSEQFLRISKGELLNARFLQGYNGDQLLSTLHDEQGKTRTFIMSENYRKAVLAHFSSHK